MQARAFLAVACVALAHAGAAFGAEPVVLLAPTVDTAVAPGAVRVTAAVTGATAQVLVDGRVVHSVRSPCASSVLDATVTLAEGRHRIVVRSRGYRAGRVVHVDATVATSERNRAETVATPRPFACLARGELLLGGRAAIGATERIVLVQAGGARAVTARSLRLRKTGVGRYAFRAPAGAFALRIGRRWGALDARGHRIFPAPSADASRAAVGTVGKAGGSLEVTDAAGVVATLAIPPGALDRDTEIRVTPLAEPALMGSTPAQPGLRFEPDGLVFARPAVLTLDYSRTTHRVTKADRISLATSALTALPLPGRTDLSRQVVTGLLPHFSTTVGGLTETEFSDLAAWADAILSAGDRPTLSEIATLMELLATQAATGCTDDCLDPQTVQAKAAVAIGGLDQEACALDVGDPSDAGLQRWLALAAVAQAVDVAADRALDCAGGVLRALIVDAGDDRERLATLLQQAQLLGLEDQSDFVRLRIVASLRDELGERRALCAIEPDHARTQLSETLAAAQSLGEDALEEEIQAAIGGCARPSPGTAPVGAPAPPPVLASGCVDDISSPTDAAVDRWRLVETGAGPGADVSAVRACIASIFGALIAQATTAAGASPTDALLQRFVDLSAHGALVGAPASSTEAIQALDARLRALLGTATATCATDAAAARALADRVLGWASAVSSVDLTLGADAQAARTSCVVAARLDVLIRPEYGPCCATGGTLAAAYDYGPDQMGISEDERRLGTTKTLPFTMTAGAGSASGTWTAQLLGPTTVAWDVDLDVAANDIFAARLRMDLTPSVTGVLRVRFNDAWTEAIPGLGIMLGDITAGGGVVGAIQDPNPNARPVTPGAANESSLDRTIAVTAGVSTTLWFQISSQNAGAVSGRGRVVTITLEP